MLQYLLFTWEKVGSNLVIVRDKVILSLPTIISLRNWKVRLKINHKICKKIKVCFCTIEYSFFNIKNYAKYRRCQLN